MPNHHHTIEFYKWPGVVSAIILLLSVFPMPYGFYTITRIVVTATAVYYAYYIHRMWQKKGFWFWCFVAVAIIFNPIVPLYLYSKALWGAIDIITLTFFIVFVFKHKQ